MLTHDELHALAVLLNNALCNASLAERGELAQGGEDDAGDYMRDLYRKEVVAIQEMQAIVARELAKGEPDAHAC